MEIFKVVGKRESSKQPIILFTLLAVISTIITVWYAVQRDENFQEYTSPSSLYLKGSPGLHQPPVIQSNDTTRLMNLKNFKFLINHSCNDSAPLLLVLVHSSPDHQEKRKAIRETWGNLTYRQLKLMFLFGIPKNESEQTILTTEDEQYGDIIQGNFLDSYRNLTYKHVMVLKWTVHFCPKAKYVLKCDDDVFANTPRILKYLHDDYLSPNHTNKSILCHVNRGMPVIRDAESKWHVAYSDYNRRYFPVYCAGFFIIYSGGAVFDLYKAAQSMKFFWVDDAFVSGFVAMKAGVKPTDFEDGMLLDREMMIEMEKNNTKNNSFLVGPINLSPHYVRFLWKVVTDTKVTGKGNSTKIAAEGNLENEVSKQ